MTNLNEPEKATRSKGLIFLIPATAVLLLAAALFFRASETPVQPPPRKAMTPESEATTPLAARPDPFVPRPPEPRASEAEVSRAMDRSTIRGLVRSLAEAAATDDAPRRISMLKALERYGREARPILEEAMLSISNNQAQLALREALAKAQ